MRATTRGQILFDGAVLFAATAGMSGTLLGWSDNPIRVLGGLALAMFTPGYALLRALYPRRLSRAEIYGLSVPVSFVLAIVIGAAVDITPIGLSGGIIVFCLWLCSVTLMTVAYLRVSRRGSVEGIRAPRLPTSIGVRTVVLSVVLVEAGVILAGASLLLASRTTPKTFTALSVDGATGVQQPGVPLSVTLDNEEGQQMQYDLQVTTGDSEISRVDGIKLDPGGRYTLQVPVLAEDDTAGADIIAYRSGETTPYRTVHVGPTSET